MEMSIARDFHRNWKHAVVTTRSMWNAFAVEISFKRNGSHRKNIIAFAFIIPHFSPSTPTRENERKALRVTERNKFMIYIKARAQHDPSAGKGCVQFWSWLHKECFRKLLNFAGWQLGIELVYCSCPFLGRYRQIPEYWILRDQCNDVLLGYLSFHFFPNRKRKQILWNRKVNLSFTDFCCP